MLASCSENAFFAELYSKGKIRVVNSHLRSIFVRWNARKRGSSPSSQLFFLLTVWKRSNRVILWLEISYWVVWHWRWGFILWKCIERMSWWPSLGQLVKIVTNFILNACLGWFNWTENFIVAWASSSVFNVVSPFFLSIWNFFRQAWKISH